MFTAVVMAVIHGHVTPVMAVLMICNRSMSPNIRCNGDTSVNAGKFTSSMNVTLPFIYRTPSMDDNDGKPVMRMEPPPLPPILVTPVNPDMVANAALLIMNRLPPMAAPVAVGMTPFIMLLRSTNIGLLSICRLDDILTTLVRSMDCNRIFCDMNTLPFIIVTNGKLIVVSNELFY